MWAIFPCVFVIILDLVRTIYLFNLASWKLAWFGFFFRWFTPGHFLRARVIYSLLRLVTVMSPLTSGLRCIYWSEPAKPCSSAFFFFLVILSFFSKSTRLFLFCKEVYLYPCLDSWRRKWKPTPVFLPGEPHRRRSLVGYSPQGRKESTKWLHFFTLDSTGSNILYLSFSVLLHLVWLSLVSSQ